MKRLSFFLMGAVSLLLILAAGGLTYCSSYEEDRPMPVAATPADVNAVISIPDPPINDECTWTGTVIDPHLHGCGLEIHLESGEYHILVPAEIHLDFELKVGQIVKLGFNPQANQIDFCQRGLLVDIFCIRQVGYNPDAVHYHADDEKRIE